LLISIITVCFNSAATIGRTIRSVDSQDYENYEHIIIDGASTDATVQIIESFGNARRKVISERDNGIYDAMNKGVRFAHGEVICFLNSDDYYSDSTVLKKIASAFRNNSTDMVVGDVAVVKRNGGSATNRLYCSGDFDWAKVKFGWMPAHPATFLKRRLFLDIGGFDSSYRISGDFELIARLSLRGNVVMSYLPLVCVHMQSGGISDSFSSKFLLNLEILRACRSNGISSGWLFMLWRYLDKIFRLALRSWHRRPLCKSS
jgi:glycosyltransferase involved in cell wall biosynthesis